MSFAERLVQPKRVDSRVSRLWHVLNGRAGHKAQQIGVSQSRVGQ